MKITYVIQSLAFKGGTERVITEKMNYLADYYNYDITIITCNQPPTEPNYFPLSDKINQINLDIHDYSVYNYKYPSRVWKKWAANSYFKKTIKKAIHRINPDIIIGVGHYKADLICTFHKKARIIIECHDARLLKTILTHKTKRSIVSKLYMPYHRWRYFRTIERYADTIVTLTDGAKERWNKARNVIIIPNISTMPVSHYSTGDSKRIIAIGRLRWEKGFERLIDIWKSVSVKYPNWQLDIYGEGELKDQLIHKIDSENILNIVFHEPTQDIEKEYANSSICVVTSYFEGFSLVLLEAIRHGLPCVAFDCPYGPSSIIQDGICGYLVEEGDNADFIKKLCTLIEDEQLRKQMSSAALEHSKEFNTDSIMERWNKLFCTNP